MPKSDPILEILDHVLEKIERKESVDEILAKYPEHADEILEFLEVHQFLRSQSLTEKPTEKSLHSAIDRCFAQRRKIGDWGFLFRPAFRRSFAAVLPLMILAIGGWWWTQPNPTPVEEEIARTVEQEIVREIDEFYQELDELEQIQETDLFADASLQKL